MEMTKDAADGALSLAVSEHLLCKTQHVENMHSQVQSTCELQLHLKKIICAIYYISKQQLKPQLHKNYGPAES